MNGTVDWLQLIGIVLSLVLVGSGLASRRLALGKMVPMALVWAGIIGIAALAFAGFRQ
jgi:energy-converting hydrogenase Eha subunit C